MTSEAGWECRMGRRLRLRDLHFLIAVVRAGSMMKAATHLGVSQPVVSEAIADLESTVGVRLLDRGLSGSTLRFTGKPCSALRSPSTNSGKQSETSNFRLIQRRERSGSVALRRLPPACFSDYR